LLFKDKPKMPADSFREDENAMARSFDPAGWAMAIIFIFVTFIVITALYVQWRNSLVNYSTNETVLGPTILTLFPIMLSVGLLIAGLAYFLGGSLGGSRRRKGGL